MLHERSTRFQLFVHDVRPAQVAARAHTRTPPWVSGRAELTTRVRSVGHDDEMDEQVQTSPCYLLVHIMSTKGVVVCLVVHRTT